MIGIVGTGAFGTALAIALAREGRSVRLWGRDAADLAAMRESRVNTRRLPDGRLPPSVDLRSDLADLTACDTILLAIPMQSLRAVLTGPGAALDGKALVACCKGVDLSSLTGPAMVVAGACPSATVALLTGPSFAADIARGLPTALTLACADPQAGEALQHQLSTPTLRLYRTEDVLGAELGGALKNVMAIAAGVVIGAGLGDSARAALMTRGYAEMARLAIHLGAKAETLAGLSGFGDLVLTCTSAQSRNFRFGQALGAGTVFDPSVTVEGAATAHAVSELARRQGLDLPITTMVSALVQGRVTLQQAVTELLSRPLKQE